MTDNSLKSTPINERLDIINSYIGNDFNEKVTMDMLNSKESISITVKPIPSSIETQQAESLYTNNDATLKEEVVAEARMAPTTNPEEGYVNGQNLQALNESKGWYREGKHGREVEVGDIWVEKIKSLTNEQTALTSKASSDEQKGKQKEKDSEVTYFPKDQLSYPPYKLNIKDGDILAITTNITGLDVVHVGFVCWVGDTLHLLHASSVAKKVILDPQPMYDYSKDKRTHTGVRIISVL